MRSIVLSPDPGNSCAPDLPAPLPCFNIDPSSVIAIAPGSPTSAVRHLPNLICLLRIALVWPIVAALWVGRDSLALALFVIAAVSDALDGYLAKRFGWQSRLGKVLDPLADKLLLVAVFIEAA